MLLVRLDAHQEGPSPGPADISYAPVSRRCVLPERGDLPVRWEAGHDVHSSPERTNTALLVPGWR